MQEGASFHHLGGLHRGGLAGLGSLHLVFEGVFAAVLVVFVALLLRLCLLTQLDRFRGMIGRLSLDFHYLCLCPFHAINGISRDRPNIRLTSGPCHRAHCMRSVVIINLFFELLKSLTIIVIVIIDNLRL